jgi:hypothetical protein
MSGEEARSSGEKNLLRIIESVLLLCSPENRERALDD